MNHPLPIHFNLLRRSQQYWAGNARQGGISDRDARNDCCNSYIVALLQQLQEPSLHLFWIATTELQEPVFHRHQSALQDVGSNACSTIKSPKAATEPLLVGGSVRQGQHYLGGELHKTMEDLGVPVTCRAVVGKPYDEINRAFRVVGEQRPERPVVGARRVIVKAQRHWETKCHLNPKVITKSRPLWRVVLSGINAPPRLCHPNHFLREVPAHGDPLQMLQDKFREFISDVIISSAFSSFGDLPYLLWCSFRDLHNHLQEPLRHLTLPMVPVIGCGQQRKCDFPSVFGALWIREQPIHTLCPIFQQPENQLSVPGCKGRQILSDDFQNRGPSGVFGQVVRPRCCLVDCSVSNGRFTADSQQVDHS